MAEDERQRGRPRKQDKIPNIERQKNYRANRKLNNRQLGVLLSVARKRIEEFSISNKDPLALAEHLAEQLKKKEPYLSSSGPSAQDFVLVLAHCFGIVKHTYRKSPIKGESPKTHAQIQKEYRERCKKELAIREQNIVDARVRLASTENIFPADIAESLLVKKLMSKYVHIPSIEDHLWVLLRELGVI
jgi:hypothetical protein